jgi:putative hydrolase of the HAD superfamily
VNYLRDIRAVTFDVGGTLIDPWPSVGHIYATLAAAHGWKNLDVTALNRQFAAAWHARGQFDYSQDAWAGIVNATFAGLIESEASRTFFEQLYQHFGTPQPWRVYADVTPVLSTLRERGVKLGIISNWDDRLPPLLQQLGLRKFFDSLIYSYEVGSAKPSPLIFNRACESLATSPGSILHIGDSAQEDAQGARRAGLHALLLRRGHRQPVPGQIQSLRALLRTPGGRNVTRP